ncbi:polysaccharide lyase family 1 protein [Novosphingobium aerophilum]|uniref:pectate lyase family protein n=1 Tax=Novosphingobium TaxID=165696 RepID=UPI001854B4A6|nr:MULTISPECIES: pectate lyase [unclassified Novosphingobium]WRT94088.1 pectate lyase [Novosphingobium sp. RL4]
MTAADTSRTARPVARKRANWRPVWFGGAVLAIVALVLGLAGTAGEPVLAAAPVVRAIAGKKAFPAAVGYGATSVGGRGGRIIYITTLADSGAGSYRACVTATGPRVCVFRVNGVIRFTQRPPWIMTPYLTIAGQTAPGGGITLAHAGGSNGLTPLVIKNTHDVVVRGIRVRTDRIGRNPGGEDDITIERSSRVVIDHVSASWARDEVINGYDDNDEITISNSIFAWGIPKHDKCALLASDPVDKQKLSFIGNVCAHNGDRNPDINFPRGSCVEVINNVLYNAASEFAEVWESYGGSPVSIVGNSFIAGTNTNTNSRGVARETVGSTGTASIYLWDNNFSGNFKHVSPEVVPAQVQQAPCPLTLQPMAATAAYSSVLARAGAFPRDAIDQQVLADVRGITGRIGAPVPAIPYQPPAAPYADNDKDGMDDAWERANGLDTTKNDAWGDRNGNGIENFEEFLAYREKGFGL